MDTPVLETQRLILRPFSLEDGKEVFSCWGNDPEVAKYMFWTCFTAETEAIAWAKAEGQKIGDTAWYRFALVEKQSGTLVGTGLIYYEEEVASWEIAYNLGKKYWRKGYVTEAMGKILEFAKKELGIKEVVGRHAKENPGSGRVMEKLGFNYVKDIPYVCNCGATTYEGKLYRLYL